MSARLRSGNPALSQVAERQMRTWALYLQTEERKAEQKASSSVAQLIKPYLVISRETGAEGSELAHRVAQHCAWRAFDNELLDYMAEHEHMSRFALECVDEKSASLFHETFGKWLDGQLVTQAEYVSRLGKIVLLAAQHESTVFVGRGAHFILPREAGMSVRVIAPKKQRVERIMQLRQCTQREAEDYVDDTDKGRADYIERYFQHDVADPHLYDLVINLRRTTLDEAAALIVDQLKRRFPKA